jgi:hypothetical protein
MEWPTSGGRARRLARLVDRQILIWTRRGVILSVLAVLAALVAIALVIWPPH